MSEREVWRKAGKKPMIVEFRKVHANEKGVETLEGYKPCNPRDHFIIRGVEGEIYPISKEIFRKTYVILDEGEYGTKTAFGDFTMTKCEVYTLKNRPTGHNARSKLLVDLWFEGFESWLRSLKRGDKGVCVVHYVDEREPTIYLDVKEILG